MISGISLLHSQKTEVKWVHLFKMFPATEVTVSGIIIDLNPELAKADELIVRIPSGDRFTSFNTRIYNRLLLNILYVINQKYGLNL